MVRATYSSAIFNFMPEWALDFYCSVRALDHAAVMRGLREFVLPYVKLRNTNRGYAVAIGKAGLRYAGRPAGSVRAPLTDLTGAEQEKLGMLIDHAGRALADRTRV
jgi:5-dehydro-4-deoxyglucarate dehydratase